MLNLKTASGGEVSHLESWLQLHVVPRSSSPSAAAVTLRYYKR